MSLVHRLLIRLARQILQSVITQLVQQFDIVEDQALNPMRQMVQAVVGGIWIGASADAFVNEVSNIMIPDVGIVGSNITTINGNIQTAIDIMDQADAQVTSMVNSLGDVFSGIF
jgi:uncharacterized protein YukE